MEVQIFFPAYEINYPKYIIILESLTEVFSTEIKTRKIASSIYYPDVLFIRINPSRGWESVVNDFLPKEFSLVTKNGIIGNDLELALEFKKFQPSSNVIFSIFDSNEIPLLIPHERFLRSDLYSVNILTYSDPIKLQADLSKVFSDLNFGNITITNYSSTFY